MKKLILLLLIATSVFSCEDEQPTASDASVNLNFKATYDGDPFLLYQALSYPDGKQIRFQNFNFFVANITLLGEGTTLDHVLSDIEFFDFKDNLDQAAAETPLTRKYDAVPAGAYKGVKLDFGVPAELNNDEAGSLPNSNPLRQAYSSHYWSDWQSFIFMKIEGIYDKNGDGIFNQSDQGFEHHPGMNDVLTSVTKLKSFTIAEGEAFDLDLTADVLKIYMENGVALDLSDPNNKDTQQLSDLPLAIQLMGNWEQACEL